MFLQNTLKPPILTQNIQMKKKKNEFFVLHLTKGSFIRLLGEHVQFFWRKLTERIATL
jgi:hypothetical protein